MTTNPYAAPKAAVADETVVINADYIPGGQSRPAGAGWTWIADSWNLFKRQPGMWIGMWLLFVIIMIGTGILPFLGTILTALFWPVFVAGFAVGCRALDEGGELEIAHLFAGFRERLGTLIGVGALSLLASFIIGMVVGLGLGAGAFTMMSGDPETMAAMAGTTVLLMVLITTALLLPVMMAAWFAPVLVVFQGEGVIDSMKGSFAGCLKNIVPFLVYGVAALLLAVVATIPIGLGWLVLGPMIAASVYTSYRDIYLKPRA
ncbi:MAG TPA: BPSS1780 family membrane protein [Burkholderiales bacterium]|nr:BPSS1780 family membrane protein [Burkholderiales bacterium]